MDKATLSHKSRNRKPLCSYKSQKKSELQKNFLKLLQQMQGLSTQVQQSLLSLLLQEQLHWLESMDSWEMMAQTVKNKNCHVFSFGQ